MKKVREIFALYGLPSVLLTDQNIIDLYDELTYTLKEAGVIK